MEGQGPELEDLEDLNLILEDQLKPLNQNYSFHSKLKALYQVVIRLSFFLITSNLLFDTFKYKGEFFYRFSIYAF